MTFGEALKHLNIEDYSERIFNSNSHGELMHLWDYIHFASIIENPVWFRPLFELCVKWAEEKWAHPEHCFQHMGKLMADMNDAIERNNEKARSLENGHKD